MDKLMKTPGLSHGGGTNSLLKLKVANLLL
jgi:hypothetical protein